MDEIFSYLALSDMKLTRFAYFSWSTLIYNILVVIWGAYVRATGSGAGCGSHWPLCNGVILPRAEQVETIIEFFHRATSGFALVMVFVLFLWGRRSFQQKEPVRIGVNLAMIFIISESLVGAALVLFSWVDKNQSVARVISISIHLINTFLLLASLALTAWWASTKAPLQHSFLKKNIWFLLVGAVLLLILGISGAITALGDTLFPAGSLAEGIQQDFEPTAHFLIKLRIWHPVIAILTAIVIVIITITNWKINNPRVLKILSVKIISFFFIQLLAGLINVLLLAPVWLQLVHLLLADLVWITYVLFCASVLNNNSGPSPG